MKLSESLLNMQRINTDASLKPWWIHATIPCLPHLYTLYFRLSLLSDINVSQGSVAIFVRCGGIFNADFIANLLTSQPVKEL